VNTAEVLEESSTWTYFAATVFDVPANTLDRSRGPSGEPAASPHWRAPHLRGSTRTATSWLWALVNLRILWRARS